MKQNTFLRNGEKQSHRLQSEEALIRCLPLSTDFISLLCTQEAGWKSIEMELREEQKEREKKDREGEDNKTL